MLCNVRPRAATQDRPSETRQWKRAERAIEQWPPIAQQAARRMLDRYGEPDSVSSERLVWRRKGPWLETIAHSFGELRSFPQLAQEVLEQTVRYDGPMDRAPLLAQFDPTLKAGRRELTASNESEAMNFATLNIAVEVLRGDRNPARARELLARIVELRDAGKASPYFEGLRFNPSRSR